MDGVSPTTCGQHRALAGRGNLSWYPDVLGDICSGAALYIYDLRAISLERAASEALDIYLIWPGHSFPIEYPSKNLGSSEIYFARRLKPLLDYKG